MKTNELSTELKILEAANSLFLQLGYHGTTLQQIATKASVNTAAIHYYFRTKENIYSIILLNNLSLLLNALNQNRFFSVQKSDLPFTTDVTQNIDTERIVWFLVNETRTNNLFIKEMIRTNNKLGNLITSIFSYPENVDAIKNMIISQLDEIIDRILPDNSDLIEQSLNSI